MTTSVSPPRRLSAEPPPLRRWIDYDEALFSRPDAAVTPRYVGYYDDVDGLSQVGRRAVVIVAPDGRVAWRWDAPEIVDLPDQDEILATLERLKGAR